LKEKKWKLTRYGPRARRIRSLTTLCAVTVSNGAKDSSSNGERNREAAAGPRCLVLQVRVGFLDATEAAIGAGGVHSILYVGILLVRAALADDLLAQLPYSLGASFADLGRALAGADSDVLAGAARAFAEIGGGVARVQGN